MDVAKALWDARIDLHTAESQLHDPETACAAVKLCIERLNGVVIALAAATPPGEVTE